MILLSFLIALTIVDIEVEVQYTNPQLIIDASGLQIGSELESGDIQEALINLNRLRLFNAVAIDTTIVSDGIFLTVIVDEDKADEAMRLFNTFSPELTEKGRGISVLQNLVGEYSAFGAVKGVTDIRKEVAGRKMGAKKGQGKKQVDKKIKREVSKLKNATDAKRMDIAKAQEFIDSLRCK